MYGRHFESMYRGSMVGSGALMFAVMGYVIAHAKPDLKVGTQVELNPKLLGPILGESIEDVAATIAKLCQPDPESRSKEKQGARLVRLGQFDYQVVNGQKYREIRDEEARREQNRIAQQKFRAKKKSAGPGPGENFNEKMVNEGQIDQWGQTIPEPEDPPTEINPEDDGLPPGLS